MMVGEQNSHDLLEEESEDMEKLVMKEEASIGRNLSAPKAMRRAKLNLNN